MGTYSIRRDVVEVGIILKTELYGVIVYHDIPTVPHKELLGMIFLGGRVIDSILKNKKSYRSSFVRKLPEFLRWYEESEKCLNDT
jgi:hypothetical protein